MTLTTRIFIFQLNIWGYSPYVTSSLMRGWVCHLRLLLALSNAVIIRSESHRAHDHILLSQTWDSPNLEGQVPTFISPRNRVAQLYPQALGSLFVASYNSQGYGGGIRPCLHTGLVVILPQVELYRKHCLQQFLSCCTMCSMSWKLVCWAVPTQQTMF
jgi:hypothetical protein